MSIHISIPLSSHQSIIITASQQLIHNYISLHVEGLPMLPCQLMAGRVNCYLHKRMILQHLQYILYILDHIRESCILY